MRRVKADHRLTGHEEGTFTHKGTERRILRCGIGPAVIVMAETPSRWYRLR